MRAQSHPFSSVGGRQSSTTSHDLSYWRSEHMKEVLTVVAGFVLFSSLGIAYLAASVMGAL